MKDYWDQTWKDFLRPFLMNPEVDQNIKNKFIDHLANENKLAPILSLFSDEEKDALKQDQWKTLKHIATKSQRPFLNYFFQNDKFNREEIREVLNQVPLADKEYLLTIWAKSKLDHLKIGRKKYKDVAIARVVNQPESYDVNTLFINIFGILNENDCLDYVLNQGLSEGGNDEPRNLCSILLEYVIHPEGVMQVYNEFFITAELQNHFKGAFLNKMIYFENYRSGWALCEETALRIKTMIQMFTFEALWNFNNLQTVNPQHIEPDIEVGKTMFRECILKSPRRFEGQLKEEIHAWIQQSVENGGFKLGALINNPDDIERLLKGDLLSHQSKETLAKDMKLMGVEFLKLVHLANPIEAITIKTLTGDKFQINPQRHYNAATNTAYLEWTDVRAQINGKFPNEFWTIGEYSPPTEQLPITDLTIWFSDLRQLVTAEEKQITGHYTPYFNEPDPRKLKRNERKYKTVKNIPIYYSSRHNRFRVDVSQLSDEQKDQYNVTGENIYLSDFIELRGYKEKHEPT